MRHTSSLALLFLLGFSLPHVAAFYRHKPCAVYAIPVSLVTPVQVAYAPNTAFVTAQAPAMAYAPAAAPVTVLKKSLRFGTA